jgi:hypothetical protein
MVLRLENAYSTSMFPAFCMTVAAWAGEPARTDDGEVLYSTSRIGVGLELDGRDAPSTGVHISGTSPIEGFRIGTRFDHRTWRHPTADEDGYFATQGIQDLPGHWQGHWIGEVSVRHGLGEARMRPGWEVGGTVGRWRKGSERIQESYEELGGELWPLREWRAGAVVALGMWDVRDKRHVAVIGRYWQPFAATLSEEDEDWRYVVGDRIFDPVEVVNPLAFGGVSAMTHWNLVFLQVEGGWEQWLPSVKNREIDQGPPEGRWQVDLILGLGL